MIAVDQPYADDLVRMRKYQRELLVELAQTRCSLAVPPSPELQVHRVLAELNFRRCISTVMNALPEGANSHLRVANVHAVFQRIRDHFHHRDPPSISDTVRTGIRDEAPPHRLPEPGEDTLLDALWFLLVMAEDYTDTPFHVGATRRDS